MTELERRAEDYAYSQFIKMIPTKDGYGYLNLEWEHARAAFLAGSKEGQREAFAAGFASFYIREGVPTFPRWEEYYNAVEKAYADYISRKGKT